MLDGLSPAEAERLKRRYDLWREAMDRLKSEPTDDEPLFPGELEIPT